MGRCTGGGRLKSWMLVNIHAGKYSAFVTDWQPHWVHMSLFFDHFYLPFFSLLAGNWFWGLLHGRFVLSFSLKLLSAIATEKSSAIIIHVPWFCSHWKLFFLSSSYSHYSDILQCCGLVLFLCPGTQCDRSIWRLTYLNSVVFFKFFFMCVDVLLACMSVSHAYLVPQEGRRGRWIPWN